MDNLRDNNLKEYASIKNQISLLEEKLKELQSFIIDYVDDEGGKINREGLGSFYFTERTTWDYSPAVQKLDQKLKDLKKIEELKKIATIRQISRALCFKKE